MSLEVILNILTASIPVLFSVITPIIVKISQGIQSRKLLKAFEEKLHEIDKVDYRYKEILDKLKLLEVEVSKYGTTRKKKQ